MPKKDFICPQCNYKLTDIWCRPNEAAPKCDKCQITMTQFWEAAPMFKVVGLDKGRFR